MSIVSFPYGKEKLSYDFSGEKLLGVLVSGLHEYRPEADGETLVRRAMEEPCGSPRLSELARGKIRSSLSQATTPDPCPAA